MSGDFKIDDVVKVKNQDIIGKVVAIHTQCEGNEIIICEIDGEFECPDGHLSYKPYEIEEQE